MQIVILWEKWVRLFLRSTGFTLPSKTIEIQVLRRGMLISTMSTAI